MKINSGKIFFIIASLIFIAPVYSQNRIEGYVYDSASILPLHDVKVKDMHSGMETETDISGYFSFEGIKEKTQLKLSLIGYRSIIQQAVPATGPYKIYLTESLIEISEIEVTSKKDYGSSSIDMLDVKLRPVNTAQDLLRIVPGLFIAQHAGGGKAEQIFLRGFDSDHGTDLFISVDGMPVNMVSHAHGQGYADLHFVIPETVDEFKVSKGPYSLKFGDFSTSGAVEFYTKKRIDKNLFKLEFGKYNSARSILMINLLPKKTVTQSLYFAGEYAYTDGYFESKQKFSRYNLFARYYWFPSRKTSLDLSASSFFAHWNASGQVPQRAIEKNIISRFGSLDNSEGGQTGRSNLNMVFHYDINSSAEIKQQLFYVNYNFNLYSNFTFFLNDPLNGDEIGQNDKRNICGYNGVLTLKNRAGNTNLKTIISGGFRFDWADIYLARTRQRIILDHFANGTVNQKNVNVYVEETAEFPGNVTFIGGVRIDYFRFMYIDKLDEPAGGIDDKIAVSPKLSLYYDVDPNVQLFVKTGFGFHSNDSRVVVTQKLENTLPRAIGYEAGSQFKIGSYFIGSIALWGLDLESEFVYVGDEAVVEPSGRSRRIGAEFSGRYQFSKWLWADFDINYTHGRLVDEPDGANFIPLAPDLSSMGGLTVKLNSGFEGSLRYRFLKSRPANETNTVTAEGHFIVDAIFSYSRSIFQAGVTFENIFNRKWNEAQFDTESRLQFEQVPVSELHFTPGTPFYIKGFIGINF